MQSALNDTTKKEHYFLQIVHGSFYGPFIEAARATCKLISSLGDKHRVVTVFLYGENDQDIAESVGGDEVIFLNASRQDLRGSKRALIKKLKNSISHHQFELCVAHRSKSTKIALKALTCPVISIHHAYGDYQHLSKRILLSLSRRRVTLVGVSKSVTNELRQTFSRWPEHKFQTLYNRIDIEATKSELINRVTARQQLGIAEDSWVIGHVGRLHPVKDQATLLRAFAKARTGLPQNARLAIIGNGRQEDALKALAESLNIQNQIHFAGYQKHAKKLFRAFDCFALTSKEETFGMVLLEAMAADVPVIVSDCGGAVEVVEDCARIFPVGDEDRLAHALIQQYKSGPVATPAEVEKRLKERFSDEAAIDRFREIVSIAQN